MGVLKADCSVGLFAAWRLRGGRHSIAAMLTAGATRRKAQESSLSPNFAIVYMLNYRQQEEGGICMAAHPGGAAAETHGAYLVLPCPSDCAATSLKHPPAFHLNKADP